jgi:1-acyl-sn-glycerol-3-phosphate acyltransferase
MCDTKIINSKCACGVQLIDLPEVISICPCEHMVHLECLGKNKYCPFCKIKITKIVKLNDYKKDPKYTQQCIDILSMTTSNGNNYNIFSVLLKTPNLADIAIKFCLAKNRQDYELILKSIFSISISTIKTKGLNKILNPEKKIFISNHNGFFDGHILYYFLKCGFLANITSKPYIPDMGADMPIVFVKRGEKQNTTSKIKKCIDDHGSICIFPEGTVSKIGTLCRFRSGAFKIGYPIYPIVLKFNNPNLYCDSCTPLQRMLIFCSNETEVELNVLDPVYPPFNKNTSEIVRTKMAECGGFVMSRVLANDIKD